MNKKKKKCVNWLLHAQEHMTRQQFLQLGAKLCNQRDHGPSIIIVTSLRGSQRANGNVIENSMVPFLTALMRSLGSRIIGFAANNGASQQQNGN